MIYHFKKEDKMYEDKVIVIRSAYCMSDDKDIEELKPLIDSIVDRAADVMHTSFDVDIKSSPEIDEDEICDHALGIAIPPYSLADYIDVDIPTEIPEEALLMCSKCQRQFSLFRNKMEMSSVVWPLSRGDVP